jgi:hypothetical protein
MLLVICPHEPLMVVFCAAKSAQKNKGSQSMIARGWVHGIVSKKKSYMLPLTPLPIIRNKNAREPGPYPQCTDANRFMLKVFFKSA